MRHRVVLALALGASAAAQQPPVNVADVICTAQAPCPPDFSIEMFDPALGRDRYLTVAGHNTLGHLGFDLGIFVDYIHKPLSVFIQENGTVGEEEVVLIKNRVGARFLAAIGLWHFLQLGVDVPFTISQSGDYFDLPSGEDVPQSGIGDPRVEIKLRLLGGTEGFGLAFAPVVTIPVSGGDGYGGSDKLSVTPKVMAGFRTGQFGVAANVGYLIREETRVLSSSVDDQILYGLGSSWAFTPRFSIIAEFFGRHGLNKELAEAPAEVDGAFEFEVVSDLRLQVGGGTGVVQGIGAPPARVFGQVRWTPDTTDTDRDGIRDKDDKCKRDREDKDNWQDQDGCPETDNDDDLLPDAQDRCPNQAEDKDAYQDDDGCPEPDNDKDGVPDLKDECPMKPGSAVDMGCPANERDKDDDGIFDGVDKCVDDPEDKDGFADDDGCPEPDNDQDGVPDGFDDCPVESEDADGFKDEDGCPDLDNDADGVFDSKDRCPTEAETINGVKDDDGCPDAGEPKALLQGDRILILEAVNFKTGTAKVAENSKKLLKQVALILIAHEDIKKVRVEGHTDDRGNDAKNLRLSQKRAESVVDSLVRFGVTRDRLEPQGFGETKPVTDNKTAKGRAQNRRVEFYIVEEPAAKPAKDGERPR